MLRIRKVLFPTDFSTCAEYAYVHAAHLARQFQAELHVLNVAVPYEADPNDPMAHYALHREDLVTWTDARNTDDKPGPRLIHTQMRMVSPAMGILSYSAEYGIDLIVMGTHGRRGLDRLFLGSVAEEVVRLATCPVFTVHAHPGMLEAHPESVRRILVPIDFSDSSALSLAYAGELASTYNARLDLLHVVQEAVLPTAYGIEPVSISANEIVSRSRDSLADLASRIPNLPAAVAYHVFVGNPARDIITFAQESKADLIVIATHGLTGLKRMLLGSVTEKVVRTSPCPVFTVKSFGKSLLPADLQATPETVG